MATSLTGLGTKRRGRRLPILPILSFIVIVMAIALFTMEMLRFTQRADALAADVSVAGVPVGGLDPRQAMTRWEQAYAQPVVLYYADSPILLDPASVGFRANSETMFASARTAIETQADFWSRFVGYMTGRQAQQRVSVPLDANYQQSLLRQYLQDLATRYDRPSGTPDYDVATLTVRSGATGYTLDVDAALPLVDAALRDPIKRTVVLPLKDSSASKPNINTLKSLITGYLDAQGFIYDGQTTVASVYIMDLETGEEMNLLSDVAFSAASTVKVSILIDYFKHLVLAPTQDEAWLMANSLLCSNNSSSNLLMQITGERVSGARNDIFAGIADVTATDQHLGARNSFITSPLVIGNETTSYGSIAAPKTSPNKFYKTGADPFNQTTTEDLGTLFSEIYDCANFGSGLMAAYPNGEFTQNECKQMLNLMSANDLNRLLQAGIPKGVRISHKNGWIDNEHGDAGIVFPPNGHNYVIAVFVWKDVDFFNYNEAWPLIEGISRAAWNYFSPELPELQARTDIPQYAQECQGNFLPPDAASVNLDDINGWRRDKLPPPPTEPSPGS